MKKCNVLMIVFTIVISGCSSRDYKGIEPLNPIPGELFGAPFGEYDIPVVESNMPTITWKPIGIDGIMYDIVVWKRLSMKLEGSIPRGRAAYAENAIETNSHKIEMPLEFDTVYLWSVRTRTNQEVGDWSHYSDLNYASFAVHLEGATLKYYSFKTPEKNQ